MASIPLVANTIKQPESPLSNLSDLLHAKAQQQGLQTGALQQQALQQENAQRDLAMKDQQAQTAALKAWDGKSMQDLPGLLLKHGGSATAVFGLKQKIVEQQTALTKLDTDTLANQAKKNDFLLGSLQSATSGPDEGLPGRVNAAAADAVQKGYLDPQHAQSIQQMTAQTADPKALRQQLTVLEKSFMGQKEQFDQEAKSREVAATEQKNKIEADRFGASMPGGALQPIEQREYSDFIAKNPGKGPTDFAKWKASLVPRAQIDVQMGGGGKGGPLTDATIDALAAPGAKLKLSDVLPARAPLQVRQAAINQVQAKYPDFATSAYDIEKGVEKDFTSGGYSQQLNSINRARNHMGTFLKLAQAMDNGDVKIINSASNFFKTQLGSSAPGNLHIAKQAFASEVGKSFAGANVTLHDREELDSSIDKASSWTQLSDAAKTADELLAGAQKALKQTHDAGIKGKANFGQENQAGVTVTDPRGVVHTFKDQASADKFKQAAGIK